MSNVKRLRAAARQPQPQVVHHVGDLVLSIVHIFQKGLCQIRLAESQVATASLATHITQLQADQQVVAMNVGPDQWLVLAALPLPGSAPPISFDPSTGTLHINAPRVQLSAVGTVALKCGDTAITLSMDGLVELRGQDILSTAVSSHRIEGASINLN